MSRTFSAKIPILPLLFRAKQRFGRKYRAAEFRQDISVIFETFGTLLSDPQVYDTKLRVRATLSPIDSAVAARSYQYIRRPL